MAAPNHAHPSGGQVHKIMGTATSTMITCSGRPTSA